MRKLSAILFLTTALFAADVTYDAGKVHYESYGKGADALDRRPQLAAALAAARTAKCDSSQYPGNAFSPTGC